MATLIQRYDKNHFISRNRDLTEILQAGRCNQFIKSFLDNRMSIFEEYGAFNKIRLKLTQQHCHTNVLQRKVFVRSYNVDSAWFTS